MRAVDHGAWHRTDHLERDGARDRQWRAFSKGRDFGAWLVPVPRQISTGDRTILGKISKQGNRHLRVLFVQAARVVLVKPTMWKRHGLKPWIEAAKRRLHQNGLAIALANRLVEQALRPPRRVLLFEPMPQVYMDSLAEESVEGLNPAHGR